MHEDKKKTWMVTLPYDDVRGMEARCEVLGDIGTTLALLYNTAAASDVVQRAIVEMLDKIKRTEN